MDEPVPNPADPLEAVEGKVRRAVEELRRLRAERDAARGEAQKLRAALRERSEALRSLEAQLLAFQGEREEVRGRIEKLVSQIDALLEAEP